MHLLLRKKLNCVLFFHLVDLLLLCKDLSLSQLYGDLACRLVSNACLGRRTRNLISQDLLSCSCASSLETESFIRASWPSCCSASFCSSITLSSCKEEVSVSRVLTRVPLLFNDAPPSPRSVTNGIPDSILSTRASERLSSAAVLAARMRMRAFFVA